MQIFVVNLNLLLMECSNKLLMKVQTLIKYRKNYFLARICHAILLHMGLDLPANVRLGKNVRFPHNSLGTVIHPNTIIEDEVWIYQNVTIGRADIEDFSDDGETQVIVHKGAKLCAGAKILCKKKLEIAENTIIAANAVLLQSTGANEVWGGYLLNV